MTRCPVSFGDLRGAAFCPRSLYYERTRDVDREPPSSVESARALERRYEVLLASPEAALEAEPIAVALGRYRETLTATRDRLRERDDWTRLREPRDRNRLVTGRDCRGVVHKVIDEPLEPVLLSAGEPPPQGVWEPQSVHAVAAAKALAWEHETPIERAWVEYPAYGVIRSLALTTRRKARYRRTLRTVREMDGPPPRTTNRAKCDACSFASECGVRTRTLRSMLGFGRTD